MDDRGLGSILLEYTRLTPQQLDEALIYQRDKQMRLGEALVQLHFLHTEDVLRALSMQLGIDYLTTINPDEIPSDLIQAVPINFAASASI